MINEDVINRMLFSIGKKRFHLRIDKNLFAELEAWCKEEHCYRSDLVEMILREAVRQRMELKMMGRQDN